MRRRLSWCVLLLVAACANRKAAIPEETGFHGWPILVETPLDADRRRAALAAIDRAIAEKNAQLRARRRSDAACFNPRHGVRAVRGGKTVELVICFECLKMDVHAGGPPRRVGITEAGQPGLDALLARR